jgi:hypothetical protein
MPISRRDGYVRRGEAGLIGEVAYQIADWAIDGEAARSEEPHRVSQAPSLGTGTRGCTCAHAREYGRFMAARKDIAEQRQYQRFQAKNGAFALSKASVNTLGQIVDISQGGLAFKYMAWGEQTNGFTEIDILFAERFFYLQNVPCKVVSDSEISLQNPFSSIKMRRLSVEFKALSPKQRYELKHFIKNHTSHEV